MHFLSSVPSKNLTVQLVFCSEQSFPTRSGEDSNRFCRASLQSWLSNNKSFSKFLNSLSQLQHEETPAWPRFCRVCFPHRFPQCRRARLDSGTPKTCEKQERTLLSLLPLHRQQEGGFFKLISPLQLPLFLSVHRAYKKQQTAKSLWSCSVAHSGAGKSAEPESPGTGGGLNQHPGEIPATLTAHRMDGAGRTSYWEVLYFWMLHFRISPLCWIVQHVLICSPGLYSLYTFLPGFHCPLAWFLPPVSVYKNPSFY